MEKVQKQLENLKCEMRIEQKYKKQIHIIHAFVCIKNTKVIQRIQVSIILENEYSYHFELGNRIAKIYDSKMQWIIITLI